MTEDLSEAVNVECSDEFCRLLYNYGLWSRYSGIKGYFHGNHKHENYVIDDETALEIDRAVMRLKQSRPKVYTLFYMYYVKGNNEFEILNQLKHGKVRFRKLRRNNYFEYNHAIDGALKYLNADAVRGLIGFAEKYIQFELKRMECER